MNNQNLITELQSHKISNNYLKFITQFPEHALTSSNVKLEIKMILNSKHFGDAKNYGYKRSNMIGGVDQVTLKRSMVFCLQSVSMFSGGPSEVAKLAPTTITTDLEKNHSSMSHIWVRFLRFY